LALAAAVVVLLYALRQLFRVVHSLGFGSAELWAEAAGATGGVHSETRAEYRRVLRAIKQLDEDRDLGKLAQADHQSLREGLTLRAVELKRELAPVEDGSAPLHPDLLARLDGKKPGSCGACAVDNDLDARFCKGCGAALLVESSEGAASESLEGKSEVASMQSEVSA
jgi:hypothetical protein